MRRRRARLGARRRRAPLVVVVAVLVGPVRQPRPGTPRSARRGCAARASFCPGHGARARRRRSRAPTAPRGPLAARAQRSRKCSMSSGRSSSRSFKRRQRELHHRQPDEISAEAAGVDLGAQIAVGGDHAGDRDLDRPPTADPTTLAARARAAELGCRIERQLSRSRRRNRAAVPASIRTAATAPAPGVEHPRVNRCDTIGSAGSRQSTTTNGPVRPLASKVSPRPRPRCRCRSRPRAARSRQATDLGEHREQRAESPARAHQQLQAAAPLTGGGLPAADRHPHHGLAERSPGTAGDQGALDLGAAEPGAVAALEVDDARDRHRRSPRGEARHRRIVEHQIVRRVPADQPVAGPRSVRARRLCSPGPRGSSCGTVAAGRALSSGRGRQRMGGIRRILTIAARAATLTARSAPVPLGEVGVDQAVGEGGQRSPARRGGVGPLGYSSPRATTAACVPPANRSRIASRADAGFDLGRLRWGRRSAPRRRHDRSRSRAASIAIQRKSPAGSCGATAPGLARPTPGDRASHQQRLRSRWSRPALPRPPAGGTAGLRPATRPARPRSSSTR